MQSTEQAADQQTSKHPFLRKLGIFLFIVIGGIFVLSQISLYSFQSIAKKNMIQANRFLTMSDVTIGDVSVSALQGSTYISNLTVYNPNGYKSPFALSIGSAEMNILLPTGAGPVQQSQGYTFGRITLNDVYINYDINAKRKVNLHQIIDNIGRSLSPKRNFSPLEILKMKPHDKNKRSNLPYEGITFSVNSLLIKKPVINIYNNGNLVKSITLDDVTVYFTAIQQPTNYGIALLTGSLDVINTIDQAVKKT